MWLLKVSNLQQLELAHASLCVISLGQFACQAAQKVLPVAKRVLAFLLLTDTVCM